MIIKLKGEKPLLIQGIPKRLKSAFKAACAKKGTTMKTVIIQFMKDFVAGR